jgi:outer membrane receptor protein involved in Fe transport
MAGVTIAVTSPALQGARTEVTNASGYFKVASLFPGTYKVVFYYADITVERNGIQVSINRNAQLYQKIDTNQAAGEVHVIEGVPNIDTTTTNQGMTLGQDYTRNIPVPGRTFEDALGAAAGTQGDGMGVSFSGSSSLENQYVVDGVNTTGLAAGTVGSPLANTFVKEIEIITGGYQAEHGRSTGGVVNVVTKTGSNEFHGTAEFYFRNSTLTKRNTGTPTQGWVDLEQNLVYDLQMGFDLGGPIIKDKLWFYVGFGPRLIANDTTRITKRRTDCRETLDDGSLSQCDPAMHQDGVPDEDQNGLLIFDELDRQDQRSQATEYQFVTKLNYALDEQHRGQLSFSGTPFTRQSLGILGEPQAVSRDTTVLTTDLSAKWTSKFNDSKTTVEGVVGVHSQRVKSSSIDEAANDLKAQRLIFGNFGLWANGMRPDGNPRESMATRLGCNDSNDPNVDPYQFIENCPDPGFGYQVGGPGFLTDNKESRTAGRLSVIQRAEAVGNHEIKAGADFENNKLNQRRLLSGNALFTNFQDRQQIEVFRYVDIAPPMSDDPRFDDLCGRGDPDGDARSCDWTPDGQVPGNTFNVAAYLQDSWQIRPNLTLNAGIRYEEQRMRYAEHVQDTTDPFTGRELGTNAMVLSNNWVPRIGAIYDWTKEGRSKVFTNWGRYYESIPMTINQRSFGGEAWMRSLYNSADVEQCGQPDPNLGGYPDGQGCIDNGQEPENGDQLTGAGVLVAPGIKSQYLDEFLIGAEYEVMEDVKVGVTYQNRRLGRVIEDVSVDNAATYILANPGSFSKAEEEALLKEIMNTTDEAEANRLRGELEQYRGIRVFDKPRRDYNGLTLIASKRFSRDFFFQGSYTYQRTTGNYQGLFSSNNGQVDPNITSQYDLIELLANRDGPLPQDRPHYFKLDTSYMHDLQEAGKVGGGVRFRALSGTPNSALGRHYRYGNDESFLLPRGAMGRSDFNYDVDLQFSYRKDLGKGMEIQGFLQFFNLLSFDFLRGQGIASVEETYTFSNSNPIVGGEYEDLVFLKEMAQNGAETGDPVNRFRNFGNATGRYAPPYAQIGARLTF